jgi:hypothetical protein
MKMKIKSKNGKTYEYDYKGVLVKEEDHKKLTQLSIENGKPITKMMGDIIRFYKDNK